MFKVVETVESGIKNYTTVPSSWVVDNRFLLWPEHLKHAEVIKLIKSQSSAKDSWSKIDCSIKATADSFPEAVKIEKIYASFQDTEDEERFFKEPNHAPKRAFKKGKHSIRTNKEETDYNKAMESVQIEKNCVSHDSNTCFQNLQLVKKTDPTNNSLGQIVMDNFHCEGITSIAEDVGNNLQPSIEDALVFIPTSTENVTSPEDQKKLDEIKEELCSINVKLDRILKCIGEPRQPLQNDIVLTKDVNFPLKNVNEITALNESLRSKDFKTEVVNRLSSIGGTTKVADGCKVMYKLVDFLFTPQVVTKYSWTGASKSSEKKECFQKLVNIVDMFNDVITLADCRHSHQRNEEFLKEKILKHSSQRCKRKGNKNQDFISSSSATN